MAKKDKRPELVAAGLRVKQARLERGMTQLELATRVGLTSISKHEQGAVGFHGETLAKVADALGVPERWILYGEESQVESRTEEEWIDASGWLELEADGTVDRFRAAGVPEDQIQHVRRTPGWKGGGSAEDYRRLLNDLLVSKVTREELPESAAARSDQSASIRNRLP